MNKYIDADRLKAELKRYKNKADERLKIKGRTYAEELKDLALQNLCGNLLHFVTSLQQEQPKEICSKCIHHGKDDDYCYNPYGGMQSLINENGVYECTGFYEKEQEQPEVDLDR